MKLFGTSGIRAIVDKDLIYVAFKVGLAVGRDNDSVVVGNDTRTSSDVMKCALISGLLAAGARSIDIGIVPTPTLAFIAGEFDAGVMITASHNPPEYNGIKLWNPDGSAFDSTQQKKIEEAILSNALDIAPWSEMKPGKSRSGAVEQHVERILRDFPAKLNCKVVVDAGGGAAAEVTPYLITMMGGEVIPLNCSHNGMFPREVEPTAANLAELMAAVKHTGAVVGIAHDGDADRMMAVDDRGRFIPGDALLVILGRAIGASSVVTTVDASMVMEEAGFVTRRTRVGDAAVSEELRKGGDFGGEASGSWIFPGISLCPDGIYAAAQIAAIASQQRISGLVDRLPSYPLRRGSIINDGLDMTGLQDKLVALKPQSIETIDGIKLIFKDGWLLVRASGTEPKVRLTAEAKSETRARQLYQSGVSIMENSIGRTD